MALTGMAAIVTKREQPDRYQVATVIVDQLSVRRA
jgi:hypothetical protein